VKTSLRDRPTPSSSARNHKAARPHHDVALLDRGQDNRRLHLEPPTFFIHFNGVERARNQQFPTARDRFVRGTRIKVAMEVILRKGETPS